MASTQSLRSVAVGAAKSAAKIILGTLHHPRDVHHKGKTDLVTETDRRSEDAIISHIQATFPDHSILAEESGTTYRDSDYLWVIDPLDGTTNFVHGYPSFGVSIAVLQNGEPIVGVVVELPVNRVYTAVKNAGAFCDNEPIHVSGVSELEQSLLVTGFGYDHNENWHRNMELFKSFTDITQGVRRLGSAAVDLCHVARGVVDGFWEFDLHPWDTAAGILLVREAGGIVTKMIGEPYSIYDDSILVSNGFLHEDMMKQVRLDG
ncbi:MAG: inositol monophosphatase [Candidatus Marinimicrobia bacterium]|nr:inositol monophosphatase [Candidatus Neomarinimicrobiota bacterium]